MSRTHLSGILHEVADKIGCQVYYKPKTNVRLKYPCIVYSPSTITDQKANNVSFITHRNYEITFMTQTLNYEEDAKRIASSVPYGSIVREFESDNIQHVIIGCSDIF